MDDFSLPLHSARIVVSAEVGCSRLDVFSSELNPINDTEWIVTTSEIQRAVDLTLKRLSGGRQMKCHCSEAYGTHVIHVLREPPLLPVTVSIDPFDAAGHAGIKLVNSVESYTRTPASGDWDLQVRASRERYDIYVNLIPNGYVDDIERLETRKLYADRPMSTPIKKILRVRSLS